jgi:hypothetical protein
MVLTGTAAQLDLYVDNVHTGPVAGATATPVLQQVGVGQHPNTTVPTYAFITEVAVYAAALTAARVNAHFLAQETNAAPVGKIGGVPGGAGGNPAPTDLGNLILASVRKQF